MITKLFPVLLAILFAGPLFAQGSAEFHPAMRKAFEYGPRPSRPVFDPGEFLNPEEAKAISDPLEAYFTKEGIDVIVVVLADLGKAPPEHVARSFATAWCVSSMHCVVLHVPGRDGSPWIVAGGKLAEHFDPAQVQQAVEDARHRAASEAKDPDKVKAAATEAAELLRQWMANALNRSEMIQVESARRRLELDTKSRQWKIATMIVVVSAVPVLAGIWLLVIFLRRRGPRYFPTLAYQSRLGAPYSGGGRAVVDLGPPPH